MMDSVINKLRNTVTTVTSTVSQLSVVLPGNPVTREFEIEHHIASAGPGLLWKIYSGYKKSTRQEAAVFIFEKKALDKWSRKNRDVMIELLKKGVFQLTKLKHPRILTVQHPLEESRDSLAFATEPIFSSLANVLGYNDNAPQPMNDAVKNYKLHEIEIKYGLLQMCEALKFLHNDAKILHGNICPESIVINQQGSWKIFGLDFSLQNGAPVSEPKPSWTCKEYDVDAHPITQPHLDYLAPEYSDLHCCAGSDMFSLGMLAYAIFNEGKPLVLSGGNWHSHRQNFSTIRTLSEGSLFCIPNEMRSFEKKLLDYLPNNRPDTHQFLKLEFFHDEGVKTLEYLDSLFQWDNLQKSKFYKGLYEILPKLPQRVRVHRVVPCLAQEFVNPTMVPFVLPNVLKIAEGSSNEEYVQHILPHLRVVMKLREPVQVLLIFMKYMELLLQKTPADITKSDVLPLIYGSLESDSIQVQELCLSIIPSFASLIDYTAMKNSLFPRIRKLCITTQSLSVRVNCILCIGKILEHLDKWLVLDFVLPFLLEIPSREPAVIMGIVGIYKLTVSHRKLGVTKEIIATKILPFLFPLCIESGLTLIQFTTIMNFIHELITCVETEHKAKLEQVGALGKEQIKPEAIMSSDFGGTGSFDAIFGSAAPAENGTNYKVNNTTVGNAKPNSVLPPMQAAKSTSAEANRQINPSAPKDLTSSLLNSNMQQMQKSFSLEGMQQQRTPSSIAGQTPFAPMYGSNPPTFQRMPSSVSIPNSMQAGLTGNQFNPLPMPGTAGPMKLSGFQNVVPNQQKSSNSFMNFSDIQGSDSSVKKLSQKDIDDFLS
ncbi:unnamed protein product, partial [Allacma fusca]